MERRPHTRFESLHLYKWISRKFRDKPLRDLVGKTVIITGANTAIGKETALELARRGARIILAYQDAPKARVAVKHISTIAHNSEVKFYQLNLTSMKSIRNFAKEVLSSEPNIHILINNADVICTSYQLTEDGYEMQFGVNHLGHFLLTLLLLECLVKSAPARVINVTSSMYKGNLSCQ